MGLVNAPQFRNLIEALAWGPDRGYIYFLCRHFIQFTHLRLEKKENYLFNKHILI